MKRALALVLALLVPAAAVAGLNYTGPSPTEAQRQAALGKIGPDDLRYLGAFRVNNSYGDPHVLSYSEGGTFLAWSEEPSGIVGSMAGTLWVATRATDGDFEAGGWIGQVSIPSPSTNLDPSSWPTSVEVTPPQDLAGDYWGGGQRPRMGSGCRLPDVGGEPMFLAGCYDYYLGADSTDYNLFFYNREDFASRSDAMHVGAWAGAANETDPWVHMKHNVWQTRVPRWFGWPGDVAAGGGIREAGHLLPGDYVVDENTLDDSGRQGDHLGPGFAVFWAESLLAYGAPGYEIPATEAAGFRNEKPAQADFDYEFDDKDAWIAATVISRVPDVYDLAGNSAIARDGTAFVVLVHDAEGSSCYNHPEDPVNLCTPCCGGSPSSAGYFTVEPTDYGLCARPELWFYDMAEFDHVLSGTQSYFSPTARAYLDLTPFFWSMRAENDDGCLYGMKPLAVTFNPVDRILFVAERGKRGNDQRSPFIHCFAVGW